MRPFLLLALMLITACAETRQNCEREVLREIRRLDELIVETRRDLARGYTYESELRRGAPGFGGGLTVCSGRSGLQFCSTAGSRRPDVVERREAVDPAAEQRKLDNLEARRMRLAQQGSGACAETYPEG